MQACGEGRVGGILATELVVVIRRKILFCRRKEKNCLRKMYSITGFYEQKTGNGAKRDLFT